MTYFESLKLFLPVAGTIAALSLTLWAFHWLLIARHPEIGKERLFKRQLTMLGLTLLGLLIVILTLPVTDSSRNQLLGLIGILISGILAFSSASIFGNLAAGILLRITQPFQTGDFIFIGDHFGRVSERGLFDTEIQTEARELVALPNSYCIRNPVRTIRSSGTLISASLSLGYDLDHNQIEGLLLEAAKSAGLEDPFVHILELGDFAVTYRVSGFLSEPKFLISSRSHLYESVLDTLHGEGLEIMSPTYVNQKRLETAHRAVPTGKTPPVRSASEKARMEEIAFDKAERASALEQEKNDLVKQLQEFEGRIKESRDEGEKKKLNFRVARGRERLKAIEMEVEAIEREDEKADRAAADPSPSASSDK
jgi:small conductance mechanosensitive channel